jgi:hypothetical protein
MSRSETYHLSQRTEDNKALLHLGALLGESYQKDKALSPEDIHALVREYHTRQATDAVVHTSGIPKTTSPPLRHEAEKPLYH